MKFDMWPMVFGRFSRKAVNVILKSNRSLASQFPESFVVGSTVRSYGNKPFEHEDEVQESSDALQKGATDVSGKYKTFKDEDSVVIFDVVEERKKSEAFAAAEVVDEFDGISLKRGVTGVFDIEDLVDILSKQKARDIFVVRVPPEYRYVSLMVFVTGRSTRHLQAIAEFVRKVYKRRKASGDPTLKIEGEESTNWKALDLGNIALHLFLKSTREKYDLESLWSLGAEFDNLCRKPDDPLIALLENPFGLEGLEPASSGQN
ncbi:mitochondrial assembly of ribosomal large subunit protein 1 [Ischnura elegans]|uniref:mitochondrial assembly of ribosomal large subunit protein 1 n=1 Tax=Ischnura elegans TaxID=197161 RepID=UPI001ED88D1C|nr:mitochondrial assembly of ribosomal large subunit protein 1 [Ischnura elegans]